MRSHPDATAPGIRQDQRLGDRFGVSLFTESGRCPPQDLPGDRIRASCLWVSETHVVRLPLALYFLVLRDLREIAGPFFIATIDVCTPSRPPR